MNVKNTKLTVKVYNPETLTEVLINNKEYESPKHCASELMRLFRQNKYHPYSYSVSVKSLGIMLCRNEVLNNNGVYIRVIERGDYICIHSGHSIDMRKKIREYNLMIKEEKDALNYVGEEIKSYD